MSFPLQNKHSWHKGNLHVAGVSDKIKKVWGKAVGLHLDFPKGIASGYGNSSACVTWLWLPLPKKLLRPMFPAAWVHPGFRLVDMDPAGVGPCGGLQVFVLFHEFPQ